ncbi:hypothetical protein [Kamptonema formosum]|uniref:hypothetical protein n=1 Tax=Kamptonema formosum TaxID=331992 RepID=UPI0012DBCE93|nr:hypothetical protein [Oscillatoria sp. PCC 10802]
MLQFSALEAFRDFRSRFLVGSPRDAHFFYKFWHFRWVPHSGGVTPSRSGAAIEGQSAGSLRDSPWRTGSGLCLMSGAGFHPLSRIPFQGTRFGTAHTATGENSAPLRGPPIGLKPNYKHF